MAFMYDIFGCRLRQANLIYFSSILTRKVFKKERTMLPVISKRSEDRKHFSNDIIIWLKCNINISSDQLENHLATV